MRIIIGALGTASILLCVYLWYSHASIYWKLGDVPLFAPKDYTEGHYTVGEQRAEPIVYIAIGDSLTAGVGVDTYTQSYPYMIASKISQEQKTQVELTPFAIPGIRSEYVVGYFLEPVVARNPDIITILIGTNDIHGNVTAATFSEHYENILTTLTKRTDATVYVITVPNIGTKDLIAQPYRYYFDLQIQKYNKIITELATKYNVTSIDLYSAHAPYALNKTYYAPDFFHPNTLGYNLWAQTIYANLHW